MPTYIEATVCLKEVLKAWVLAVLSRFIKSRVGVESVLLGCQITPGAENWILGSKWVHHQFQDASYGATWPHQSYSVITEAQSAVENSRDVSAWQYRDAAVTNAGVD
jgi:hypothetical protein